MTTIGTAEHDRHDDDRLSRLVERLRWKHEHRTEVAAVFASMVAFRRWGVRPPVNFFDRRPSTSRE